MNEKLIQEVIDRVRRIETKVSRILVGEADKGVVATHELDALGQGQWQLKLHSLNITLIQLGKIVSEVPPGDEVDIFDDGRYIMTTVVR